MVIKSNTYAMMYSGSTLNKINMKAQNSECIRQVYHRITYPRDCGEKSSLEIK